MSSGDTLAHLIATPLSRQAYEQYGCVIAAFDDLPYKPANMDTAKRFNHLCNVENLRADKANLNLCIFRCSPLQQLPLPLKLLERHQFSTQVFMPMTSDCKYLAIVCLGGDKPDLKTLSAFIVEGSCGISYYPGVWHYPMTALDSPIDFSCLVYENESKEDCEVVNLDEPVLIDI